MTSAEATRPTAGEISLFDGETLDGWHPVPRVPAPPWPGGPEPDTASEEYRKATARYAKWSVQDHAIIGEQDTPGGGYGGYLLTDQVFGDFELSIDARPDWGVDTGILLRTTPLGSQGFQVLLDHRKSGGIGGFYGNGLGGFHALPYGFDAKLDEEGRPCGLISEDPATTIEPVTEQKRALLTYAAPVDEFLATWRWNDWNTFKILCVGRYPRLTTWINDVKICEIDTASIDHPHYDPEATYCLLGHAGHIALEVHDNDPAMAGERWSPGAVCRWKNVKLRQL